MVINLKGDIMKKTTANIAIKITAVIMSFLIFAIACMSTVACVFMFFNDFYTRDFSQLEKQTMNKMARSELYGLANKYDYECYNQNLLKSYYSDKNVYYKIYNNYDGTEISNYDGQDCIVSYTETISMLRYIDESGNIYSIDHVYFDNDKDAYLHCDSEKVLTKINQEVEYTVYIPKEMQFTDRFFLTDKLITFGFNNRYVLIFSALISIVLCVVIYSYLFVVIGHSNSSDSTVKVSAFNNIPIDIFSCIVFASFIFGVLLIDYFKSFVTQIAFSTFVITAFYFVSLWYLLSGVVQIKAKTILKHTAIYWILKKIKKIGGLIKHIYKNFSTIYKVILVMAAYWVAQLIFMGINAYENDNLIIGWLFLNGIVSVVLLLCAIAFQRVKQGGEKIVNGDLENKIDTAYMFGDIKDFAESLNNINQGLQSAIDDKVKSERFKTELITNVSHDIKTPLTSIVNYVDLIQKEECDNEKINEYIEVLDRQSKRLKKLIEDLVEASKATTGNITVELTKCNLSVLINQALGEFSQKLDDKNLQVVQNIQNDEIYILADGRRLWRVIDNLLNNICKYALSGTRVYIDLIENNGKAEMTFKNISEEPINVSANDLTERFVRGDRSRNTEGSGLGLSIAKSLTELQNGSFEITTDADLFKVKIIFDIVK